MEKNDRVLEIPELPGRVPQIKVQTGVRGGLTTKPTGGTVDGVYYPDQSGVCGETLPPPATTGGGYVAGVYYPDKSGAC